MALDVNKLRQQEQVQATGTSTPAASTSASSSSRPIDMKTGNTTAEEKRQKEIEFINSAEFKNCPDKDKIELLKQQFPYLNELSTEEFNKYFTEIKNAAQEKAQQTQTTDTQTPEAEGTKTQTAEVKTPENETEIPTETSETTSELETLADEYAKANKLEANIDDIIAHITTIQRNGIKLTEVEQKILDMFSAQNSQTHEETEIEAKTQTTSLAVSTDTLNDALTKKDVEERIDTILDNYLKTHDPEYEKAENKQAYLESKRDELYKYVSNTEENQLFEQWKAENNTECDKKDLIEKLKQKDERSLTENEKRLLELHKNNKNILNEEATMFMQVMTTLQILHDENKSINELDKISKEEFDKKTTLTVNKILTSYYNDLEKEHGRKEDDKLLAFYDMTFRIIDPEYINLDEDQQAYQCQEHLRNILREQVLPRDFNALDDKSKEVQIKTYAMSVKNIMKNEPSSTTLVSDEIGKIDEVQRIQTAIDNLNRMESTQNRQKQIEFLETELEFAKIIKENPGIDCKETYKRLKIIADRSNNQVLKDAVEDYRVKNEIAQSWDQQCNQEEHQYVRQNKFDASNLNECKDYFKSITSPELRRKEVALAILATRDNPEEEANIRKAVEEIYGWNDDEITKIFYKNKDAAYMSQARRRHDSERFADGINNLKEIDPHGEVTINSISAIGNSSVVAGAAVAAKIAGRVNLHEDKLYMDAFTTELNKDPNYAKEVVHASTKEDSFDKGELAALTNSVVENAQSDEIRLEYGEAFSQMGNSAVLEGLAASSDSFENQSYKNQFNSIVTEAAQSYPPEVQQNIQTALTTGNISQQTMTSTEPATNSYYSQADTYVPTTGSTNNTNSSYSSQNVAQDNTPSNTPNYTTPQSVGVSPVDIQNIYTPHTSPSINLNSDTTQTRVSNDYTTTPTSATSTSKVDYQQVKDDAAVKQTQANQQMKDIALENVAQTKQKIDESIAEWELKQELKLSDEVISELKEVAAKDALTEYIQANPTRREEIIKKLSNASSLSEVYDILYSNLGSKVHQKFIDSLAAFGSSSDVRAFIKSKAGNNNVIKEILLRTSNQTLRGELLNMLPTSDVIELLEKNLISTLNNVDHKIIYEYLSKNIYSMTQTNFANYLKYLPFDEREKLIAMRNKAYGIQVEEKPQTVEHQTQITAEAQQTQTQNRTAATTGQTPVATNPQNPQHRTPETKKADQVQQDTPQTRFKDGETTKTLNDGRIITNQGTSFAGISNNANDEGFRVIDPKANKKAKDGSPIGMNDEVLTPGSPEWLKKYNRQAPTTAFTMAALEEQAEDTGLNLGSNYVKKGQPIKKKYNTNGFNIRG